MGDTPAIFQANEVPEAMQILWAEGANDPEGWTAKLNTYYKMRKDGESMVDAMKRVSSAYRAKSPQYIKAKNKEFNGFEKQVWTDMQKTFQTYKPDDNWKYMHHESYDSDIYEGMSESQIDKKLQKLWGAEVDFEHKQKIGKEYYFPVKTSGADLLKQGMKDIRKEENGARQTP